MLSNAHFTDYRQGALGAADLVAMRGVHQHRQVELPGQFQLCGEEPIFFGGDVVIADLAHRHHAVLDQIARQNLQHFVGNRQVVGLFGIQADGAEVMDAEHAGAKAFPAEQGVEVVDETADAGARLALPECRFDDTGDAGGGHVLVVVGGAADHVDMRIEVLGHGESSSKESVSSGSGATAAAAVGAAPGQAGRRRSRGAGRAISGALRRVVLPSGPGPAG